jgi:hypothetical protein
MLLIFLLHVLLVVSSPVSCLVSSICFTRCFTSNPYPSVCFIPKCFTLVYHGLYMRLCNLFHIYSTMDDRYINYCSYLYSSLVYTLYSFLE